MEPVRSATRSYYSLYYLRSICLILAYMWCMCSILSDSLLPSWTVTCQVPLSMRCYSTSIYKHLHPKFEVTYDDCFDSFCGSACGLHEWLLLFILTGLSAAPQNLCQLLSCSPISGHPPTSTPPHHPLQTSPEGCGVTSCLDLSYHS